MWIEVVFISAACLVAIAPFEIAFGVWALHRLSRARWLAVLIVICGIAELALVAFLWLTGRFVLKERPATGETGYMQPLADWLAFWKVLWLPAVAVCIGGLIAGLASVGIGVRLCSRREE